MQVTIELFDAFPGAKRVFFKRQPLWPCGHSVHAAWVHSFWNESIGKGGHHNPQHCRTFPGRYGVPNNISMDCRAHKGANALEGGMRV